MELRSCDDWLDFRSNGSFNAWKRVSVNSSAVAASLADSNAVLQKVDKSASTAGLSDVEGGLPLP